MNRFCATIVSLYLLPIVLVCVALRTSAQDAGQRQSVVSPSTRVAEAIQSGTLQLTGEIPETSTVAAPTLTCSPAPCVLPHNRASEAKPLAVNEDPISVNPRNRLQLLSGGNDYNCSNLLGFYTSNDGGSTWIHSCMNAYGGTVGLGDPAVGYDLNNTAYITGIDGSSNFPLLVVFEKSTDNGKTWSSPSIAARPALSSGMIDKDWLAIDTSATSQFANALYVSATSISKDRTQDVISVSHSNDGGATWRTTLPGVVQTLPDEDQFSDLAVGKDGTVYVTWLHCTQKAGECAGTTATMFFSKSTDGGSTWSHPAIVASVNLAPHTGTCNPTDICNDGELPNTNEPMINVPVIGVDNSKGIHAGNLYVAMYNYGGIPTHVLVEVAMSSDGGSTWGTPVPVAPSSVTHDQFFPWLSVGSSGAVGVTWLDRRNDPSNISYQPFAAVSTNGGVSYGKNFNLYKNNKELSNPNNDGFGGDFMGDYTGNVWASSTLYTSWMDSNNGKRMQDEVGGLLK